MSAEESLQALPREQTAGGASDVAMVTRLSGPLLKCSSHTLLGWHWQLRWFEVGGGSVRYYDSPDEAKARGKPKREISVAGLRVQNPINSSFQFTASQTHDRIFSLDADVDSKVRSAGWELGPVGVPTALQWVDALELEAEEAAAKEQAEEQARMAEEVKAKEAAAQHLVAMGCQSAKLEQPLAEQVPVTDQPSVKQISFDELKQRLSRKGTFWKPKAVIKSRNMLGEITGKTVTSSMTLLELRSLEERMRQGIQKDEHHADTLKCLQLAMQEAERCSGKAVQLPHLLVLHASKWNVKLHNGEALEDVPFFDLDFSGGNKPDIPKPNWKVEIKQKKCMCRGYHEGTCQSCGIEMSQLFGAMTSALVDGFSGPMEIAITSCIGLPRTWNFNAGLAETCGLCFCCYFMPHNLLWFDVWADNVLRDALVGKSTTTRFAMAVVHEGGQAGNYMQQMELPFTYLYDLEVLLLEPSKLRSVFIETGLMERTVEFVTGSDDGTVRMWTARGAEMGKIEIGATVYCVDITHDFLFAGDRTGKVHKYRRSDFGCCCSKKIHREEINSLTVACGFMFTAGNDHTVKMSEIQHLDIIQTFGGPCGGLGRVHCIAVGVEFFFTGGGGGAQRFSHQGRAAKATPILPETGQFQGISHMVLNGRSLFMTSRGDSNGQLYFLRDAYMSEEALSAKVVFSATEHVRCLAMGGEHLFVATDACIYKLDARNPQDGPVAGINVTPLQQQALSKVWVLKVFGEIAVVGYFPGSWELGIFNTKTGNRVALENGAFEGHTSNIGCIAVG